MIFLWLLFGGIVGWIASLITGDNARMGIIANIVVGLLGSMIGVWIASLFGIGTAGMFSISTLLIAIGGAVVLLAIINLIRRR